MRLALVPPSKLTSEQLPLYEDMEAGISAKYGAFTTMRDDGTILGPWSAWLHDPKLGTAIWSVTKAMTRFRHLPEVSRQIVILVDGTRFRAAYEIHAHSSVLVSPKIRSRRSPRGATTGPLRRGAGGSRRRSRSAEWRDRC
jgi:4-carboxymuconolactone decarboxylase